jgi:SAM-dependent methyltransferase
VSVTEAGQIRIGASPYDQIAELYDPWSRSVTEDVAFYVGEARRAGGPVAELGVGTGRIAIPIAASGIPVIGIDSSREMLAACARRASAEGVAELLDLRLGDLRQPPLEEELPLVLCPFRSYLHLADDGERVEALTAARRALAPGGRLVFDVFEPKADDIAETHGRWLEREPGIFERADWDERARTLTLSVRGPAGAATMSLAWVSREEWQQLLGECGFELEACYGWFDRSPYRGDEDMVFVARAA